MGVKRARALEIAGNASLVDQAQSDRGAWLAASQEARVNRAKLVIPSYLKNELSNPTLAWSTQRANHV